MIDYSEINLIAAHEFTIWESDSLICKPLIIWGTQTSN